MATTFYSDSEIAEIGFKSLGENVKISRMASIRAADKIAIGNNVQVDDFCVLSGNIVLGNYVHISVYSALFGGKAGIEMQDFSGVSSRCAIYAGSDDYSGKTLTNPTVPEEYRGPIEGKVILKKHVIIGSGTTILPGVEIGEGSAVGSMSLVNKTLDAWGIYVGIPCRYKKERSKELLKLEKLLLDNC